MSDILDDAARIAGDAEKAMALMGGLVSGVAALADALSQPQPGDSAHVRAQRKRLRLASRRMAAILQNADAAVKASGILED